MNSKAQAEWSAKPLPDQETARKWLWYSPDTGILTWRRSRSSKVKCGQEAGFLIKGPSGKTYRRISFKDYGQPLVHRVIWVWMTGHCLSGREQVDHKDGDGTNNRWSNLRLVVGHVEQHRNGRLRATNKTGVVGVHFNRGKGKYEAQIGVKGKLFYLGRFDCFEDAVAARQRASEEYGFHPNHGQERPL